MSEDTLTDEDIQRTHPGFAVSCQACGSTRVIVDDSRGYSDVSGPWGYVSFECLDCKAWEYVADPDEGAMKSFPGFTVACQACGSADVVALGGLELGSGRWNAVDLRCNACGAQTEVASDG